MHLLNIKKSVVCSFIHRIYRASTSWAHFHKGINEAKDILKNNQYPLSFIEPIINSTLNKLIGFDENKNNMSGVDDNSSENSYNDISLDSNACMNQFKEKDKFMFFLQYRGKITDKLSLSFKKLNAPCKVIMTMYKTKQTLPSLKPLVPKMLQSNVVYKIVCPRCESSYVGQTARHLQQRFREHVGNKGPVKSHFDSCNVTPNNDLISVLSRTHKGESRLLTLEALFIKEIIPVINTKDEFKSRTLTLKF